jgi:hypothetical protein
MNPGACFYELSRERNGKRASPRDNDIIAGPYVLRF